MDRVIDMETSEDFSQWRWYAGAIQQHHYALLLAVEIIMNPRRKDSSRIWKGLSYVFEPPPLPPIARARWVISQAWWRMEVYLSKRSLRVPINLEENLRHALKLTTQEYERGARQSTTSSDTLSFNESSPEPPNARSNRRASHLSSGVPALGLSKYDVQPQAQGQEGQSDSPPMFRDTSYTTARSQVPDPEPAKQFVDIDWVSIGKGPRCVILSF